MILQHTPEGRGKIAWMIQQDSLQSLAEKSLVSWWQMNVLLKRHKDSKSQRMFCTYPFYILLCLFLSDE